MKSSLLSAADSCIGLMKQVNHILSLVPAEFRTGELIQEHQVKNNSQPFPETFPVRKKPPYYEIHASASQYLPLPSSFLKVLNFAKGCILGICSWSKVKRAI